MAERHSRWVDAEGGGCSSMDRLMRPLHSGTLGCPLTSPVLAASLRHHPERSKEPPAITNKWYAVFGRSDPYVLNTGDMEAFEKLETMLEPVDMSRPGSGHVHVRPSSPFVQPAVTTTTASFSQDPARGGMDANAAHDNFPLPPGAQSGQSDGDDDDDDECERRGGAAAATQTVSRTASRGSRADGMRTRHPRASRPAARRQLTKAAAEKATLSALYLPSSRMLGAIPPARAKRASTPQMLPIPATVRSPEALLSFGQRFAECERRDATRQPVSTHGSRPRSRGSAAGGAGARPSMSRAESRDSIASGQSSLADCHSYAGADALSQHSRALSRPASRATFSTLLLTPVPRPLFSRGNGRSAYDASEAAMRIRRAQAAIRYEALAALPGEADARSSELRLLASEILSGVRDDELLQALQAQRGPSHAASQPSPVSPPIRPTQQPGRRSIRTAPSTPPGRLGPTSALEDAAAASAAPPLRTPLLACGAGTVGPSAASTTGTAAAASATNAASPTSAASAAATSTTATAAAAALDTSTDGGLGADALLDIFNIATAQLPLVRTVLARVADAEANDHEPVAVQAAILEVISDLVPSDHPQREAQEAHADANLRALLPWRQRVPPLRSLFNYVAERIEGWTFDATGRLDGVPRLREGEGEGAPRLSVSQLHDLKRLAFVLDPPARLDPALLRAKQAALLGALDGGVSGPPRSPPRGPPAGPPTALITVGAPGSGKSFVAQHHCTGGLHERGLGPPPSAYVRIDPDYWLTEVCDNDNSCRHMANYMNHESFLLALTMRRPILFDGTGKSLLNTCGRVIARLRAAGYRVHMCVTLASADACVANIAERREATGRDVPTKVVQQTFDALKPAVMHYLRHHRELTHTTLVYDNDARQAELAVELGSGDGEEAHLEEALALARKYLL